MGGEILVSFYTCQLLCLLKGNLQRKILQILEHSFSQSYTMICFSILCLYLLFILVMNQGTMIAGFFFLTWKDTNTSKSIWWRNISYDINFAQSMQWKMGGFIFFLRLKHSLHIEHIVCPLSGDAKPYIL